MTKIFKKSRCFCMEEKDVTTMLRVVNMTLGVWTRYYVGCCQWKDQPKMWFIRYYASDKQHWKISKCLSEIGTLKVDVTEIVFEGA